jgi:hypothetical protein
MMMSPLTVEGKPSDVAARWAELTGFVSDVGRDGLPAHDLERGLCRACCGWTMNCERAISPWPAMATVETLTRTGGQVQPRVADEGGRFSNGPSPRYLFKSLINNRKV